MKGNITEIIDNAQQTHYFNNSVIEPRNLYEYDALYRLTKASGREHINNTAPGNNDFVNNLPLPNDATALQNYIQTYVYDQIGNIIQIKSSGGQNPWTRDYVYNFDEATEANNYLIKHDPNASINSYEYDAHGNMTSMPHLPEMLWDYKDNFKEATLDLSGNKVFYTYDAEGNRVRKVVVKGNILEERFYVGDYEVYRKTTNGTFNIERKTLNIMDNKQKIAQIDSDETDTIIRYQLSNHLGSASLELDENAEIISYEEYYPFGSTSYKSGRSESEVSQKRYKYVGKERDEETGLYYYGARYYASWLGRWTAVDPLADHQKQVDKSPYTAFWNNPIKYTDPDGKCPNCPNPTFGFGLSFGSGGFKANFNFTLDQKVGDFTGSYGLGITYHSDFFNTGKSGFEFRNSFMLNYDDGKIGVSIGTNIWDGIGEMKEFDQRTGMFSFRSGDFIFSYENDGTPFQYIGLGDGRDSYRTAAASIGIGDFSLNMNLFTGLRDKDSFTQEKNEFGGKKGIREGKGEFGETYKHGFVFEKGPKYRYGGLTLNYKGLSGGVNSEWVRHAFQNVFAHDIIKPQRQFKMLSNDWKPVMNLSNQGTSKFTIWGQ